MDGYDSNDGIYKRIYCDSDNDGKRDESFVEIICGKVRIIHPESCGKVEVRRQLFVGPELLELVPSGTLLHSYWKYRIWFVDLPIQNGDAP